MRGTIKELIEVITFPDGTKPSQPLLSAILKLAEATGDAKVVGMGPKPKRGRPAAIWEVGSRICINLTIDQKKAA